MQIPKEIFGQKLKQHQDGSVYVARPTREIRDWLNRHFVKSMYEERWYPPLHENILKNFKSLKDKYVGEEAVLVGKGKSIAYLKKSHLDGKVVLCCNEAIDIVEPMASGSLALFSCQADLHVSCKPKDKEAGLIVPRHVQHKFSEYENLYVFDDNITGFVPPYTSVLAALTIKIMGIKKVTLAGFDAMTEGDPDYADQFSHLQPVSLKTYLRQKPVLQKALKGCDINYIEQPFERASDTQPQPQEHPQGHSEPEDHSPEADSQHTEDSSSETESVQPENHNSHLDN